MNRPSLPGSPQSIRTPPFAHYGIAWSPFHPHVFALASAANYGLIGNGRVHIARAIPGPGMGVAPPVTTTTGNGGVVSAGIQLDKL